MEVKTIHKVIAGVWAGMLALVAGIFILALYFSVTAPENFQVSQGLAVLLLVVAEVALFYLAPLTLVIIAAFFIKDWWEENRKSSVTEKRSEISDVETELRSLRTSVEIIQEKITHIENILEKVSD